MSNTTQTSVIIVLLRLFRQALKAHNSPLIHSLLSKQFAGTLVYRKLLDSKFFVQSLPNFYSRLYNTSSTDDRLILNWRCSNIGTLCICQNPYNTSTERVTRNINYVLRLILMYQNRLITWSTVTNVPHCHHRLKIGGTTQEEEARKFKLLIFAHRESPPPREQRNPWISRPIPSLQLHKMGSKLLRAF